jgi:hypothetical protein
MISHNHTDPINCIVKAGVYIKLIKLSSIGINTSVGNWS